MNLYYHRYIIIAREKEFTSMDKKTVCIRLTPEEHKQLKKIAQRERRSVSNVIEVWISEHKGETD